MIIRKIYAECEWPVGVSDVGIYLRGDSTQSVRTEAYVAVWDSLTVDEARDFAAQLSKAADQAEQIKRERAEEEEYERQQDLEDQVEAELVEARGPTTPGDWIYPL